MRGAHYPGNAEPQSHPFARATRYASIRFSAPSLPIASLR